MADLKNACVVVMAFVVFCLMAGMGSSRMLRHEVVFPGRDATNLRG